MKDSDEIKSQFEAGRLDMEKYILVVFFLVQQRWGYIISKELEDAQITTKQWLLLIIMSNAFQNPPSMQEVADAMSTTHQNVKQLASRLEHRGFLKIERDPTNRRIIRLKITDEYRDFWEKRTQDDIKSIKSLFIGLQDQEIKELFEIIGKMEKISGDLYLQAKNR